jgi:integrase/recombinase XerC
MMRSLELVKSAISPLERRRLISAMSDDDLKRYAAQAVNERDHEALWILAEAYAQTKGRKGVRMSAHTLRSYQRGILDILTLWEDRSLLRPGRDAGVNLVQDMRAGIMTPLERLERQREAEGAVGAPRKTQGLSDGSIAVRLAAGRLLYSALRWAGLEVQNPFEGVSVGKVKSRLELSLTDAHYTNDELERLMQHARDSEDALILYLGAHAGFRVSEMLQLSWDDVLWEQGELRIRAGKGGKTALVMMSEGLIAVLRERQQEHLAEPNDDPRVMNLTTQSGIFNRLKRLCQRAQVPFKGVHGLRHSAGTWVLEQTGRIDRVQEHLRHETLEMARHYARGDRRALKDVLKNRR